MFKISNYFRLVRNVALKRCERMLYEQSPNLGFAQYEARRRVEHSTISFEKRRNEFEIYLNENQQQHQQTTYHLRFVKEDFLNSLTLLSKTESDLDTVMDFFKK